jgi:predicted nucleic acid-binding protein
MATLLLDTSVIIDAVNEKKNRRQFLRTLVERGNILACCPINITEIYAGMRPKEEAQTTAFLESLDLYPITFSVARLAGELKRDFGKKGTTLSVTDSLIAAVAIEYELALLTDNTKDFPMKNLKLYPLPED